MSDKPKHFRITLADGETVDHHADRYYVKGGCICFANKNEYTPRLTLSRNAWTEVQWVKEPS